MNKEDQRITFRMTGKAKDNLDHYCSMTGQKPSEVARSGIAMLMGPYLNSFVGQVSDNSRARTRLTNKDISKDISSCQTKEKNKSGDIQAWFKKFWLICKNRKFPERVIKTIKDKWEVLKEKDPEDAGQKYNEYCRSEGERTRNYKDPNSWLNDGGYDNEADETNQDVGMNWDVE